MRHLFAALLLCATTAHATVTAKSYIVTAMDGRVIAERQADDVRSIASITKLVTVERNQGLPADELITIIASDLRDGRMRSTPLKIGQSYPRSALIELALVSSDNVAAIALGRTAPETAVPENFRIVEASGLNPENKTTARSLAEYARHLYVSANNLAATSVQPTTTGPALRRSTNPLLTKPGWEFHLSKTGFINNSGGCLVVVTRIGGELMTVVLLGSTSVKQRWRDLAELRQELGDSGFAKPTEPAKSRHTKRKHRRSRR
jgi:serine-type D-Ala-D-Ala endopeptidase (penicillin-binding protein 7)